MNSSRSSMSSDPVMFGLRYEHEIEKEAEIPRVDIVIHAKDEAAANFLGAYFMSHIGFSGISGKEVGVDTYSKLKQVQDENDAKETALGKSVV